MKPAWARPSSPRETVSALMTVVPTRIVESTESTRPHKSQISHWNWTKLAQQVKMNPSV